MDSAVEYIKNNANWIFSGVGVSILGVLGYLLRSVFKHDSSQSQKVDKSSIGIQAGRDVKINRGEKGRE